MKKRQTLFALSLVAGLSACNEEAATSVMEPVAAPAVAAPEANTDSSPVLATVNGSPITQQTLDVHIQQRNMRRPGSANQDNEEQVLQELINLELMQQEAQKKGIQERGDVITQLAHQKRAFLAGLAVQEYMSSNKMSEEETKAMYDERFGAAGQEYKARHILLKEEAEAKDIITQLETGGDFAELAKQHSTGPTGANGGDLGWFSPSQMVQPFSEAAAALEKGSYSKTPVQTQFGWHVILLEDSRASTPPPYDQVKGQLQMMAQNQRLQQYLETLRSAASIETTNSGE